MTMLMSRRQTLAATMGIAPLLATCPIDAQAQTATDAVGRLLEVERAYGGRLGVAVLNLGTGKRIGHRDDERFLMCSTFTALAAAFVLARVDSAEEHLDRPITIPREDLLEWSPRTKARVGGAGMTVAELCDAAVAYSDNTAANLLLASFGGPAALTSFVGTIGDELTRFDRTEPDLNEHDGPGDLRDTTTPGAMLENLRKILFGDVLSGRSRAQFAAWMIANKTGDERLSGLPDRWLVADKTGTNSDKSGNANDVGVAWPTDRGPIIVTAYCQLPGIMGAERNAVIAEVGRIAAIGEPQLPPLDRGPASSFSISSSRALQGSAESS